MLWFVNSEVAKSVLAGKLIEQEVETRPERVRMSVKVAYRNTHNGCAALLHVVEAVKKNPVWYCGQCTSSISDDTEYWCLLWYHFKCTGIKQSPKFELWSFNFSNTIVIVCAYNNLSLILNCKIV